MPPRRYYNYPDFTGNLDEAKEEIKRLEEERDLLKAQIEMMEKYVPILN